MGKSDSTPKFRDVYKEPWIGRLDPSSPTDGLRDAAIIRDYIRLEKRIEALAPGLRPTSARAREVLLKVWQAPRIGFHEEALKSFPTRPDLRSKLLWIPWSVEAAQSFNENHSAEGLVLEHVTPIDWMWKQLKQLDADYDDPTSDVHPTPGWGNPPLAWENHAAGYLNDHWMVATVTKEQASAIDFWGSRKEGFEPNPFVRYYKAEKAMDKARKLTPKPLRKKPTPPLSTARFIIPGHANDTAR